jgi:cobalt-zinc-cadmium efflux system outer membrane protein
VVFIVNSRARWTPLLTLLLCAGCASIPADRGLSDVQAQITERGGAQLPSPDSFDKSADDAAESAQLVSELLSHTPLTVDDAVRIALIANPKLRSEYAKLGLSGAEVYSAGRLSNPTLSASILFGGDGDKTTFGLAQSFTDLLFLPARSRLAQAEFERAKVVMGGELINFSGDVEAAYYRLVGATQVARMRAAVAQATTTSAALAQRFADAGTLSALALAQNQIEAEQTQLDALAAQGEVATARAALNQLMGLDAARNTWTVAEQLPAPVAVEDELPALQTLAERSRLDLDAARRKVVLLEDALGVARSTRFLGDGRGGDGQVGVETEREADGSNFTGPTLALQLPLFQQGQGSGLRARSQLELSRAARDALQVEISNAVQLAHTRVTSARTAALRYQQIVVPLRASIVKHTQREANYMLIGQFELIRAKQQEYETYQKALEAARDYWLARIELARAVGSRLPSTVQITTPTSPAAPCAQPDDHVHQHQH